MKKSNKIIAVVDPSLEKRRKEIARIAVKLGFAIINSDAIKIIKSTPYDFDLSAAYFVIADTYNFRESSITTQRLYELSARGIAVIVGVKRLPPEFELICEAIYP